MVRGIYWAAMVASGPFNSSTITVRIPPYQVTAQASLARMIFTPSPVMSAQAYILGYCVDIGGQTVCKDFVKSNQALPSILTTEEFPKVTSVTFKLDVINGYAYGTGLVFLHG